MWSCLWYHANWFTMKYHEILTTSIWYNLARHIKTAIKSVAQWMLYRHQNNTKCFSAIDWYIIKLKYCVVNTPNCRSSCGTKQICYCHNIRGQACILGFYCRQVWIKRINTAWFPKRKPKAQASKGDRRHAPHTAGTFLDLNSLKSPSLDFGAIQTLCWLDFNLEIVFIKIFIH